jgi:NADH-quinone oxidoreductase subunit C
MTPQAISEKLTAQFPSQEGAGVVIEAKIDGAIDPYLKITPAMIAEVATFLRDDAELQFDFLMCLSGVDYTKGMLGVVYHLYSMTMRHKITLKVDVPVDKAELPSVTIVWPGANWHEREAFDLFGISFTGHPDLRRILLPEDYPGHPLRKDFKVPEFYQGMKVPY